MKEFDDIFRNRLRKYGSEVPDSIWGNIENKKSKKRRPLFWIWGGVGIVILSAFLIWNSYSHNSGESNFNSAKSEKKESMPQNIIAEKNISENKPELNYGEGEINLAENKKGEAILKKEKINQPSFISKITIGGDLKNSDSKKINQIPQTKPNGSSIHFDTKENTVLSIFGKIPPLISPVKSITENLEFPAFIIEPEEENKKDQHIYIDLLAGANIHHQILKTKNSEYEYYRQLRDTTETERISYSAGVRISKIWKNGLAFRTGLNYTLLNEKFHWEKSHVSRLVIENDTLSAQHGRWIKTTWNRYHFLEVPLLFGYENKGEKWDMSFSAGPMVNLWFHHRGDFMSPGKRPVQFTKYKSGSYPAFRKWAGVSLFASTSLNFRLNKDIQVLLEPYARYQLTNIGRGSYPLEQRFLSGGILLGLRKKL